MAYIIEKCEKCGQPNDRKEFANWCSKCANNQEHQRSCREGERINADKEFWANRPR